jgi:CRP-like cAMP-binding protein
VLQPDTSGTGNILLGALSSDDYALLRPHLTRVPFDRGLKFVTPGEPIKQVYFPEGGVASIVSTMEASGRTEAGIFGREGVSATGLLLGTDRSPHESFVQVPGASALRIDTPVYLAAIQQSETLRMTLLRYVQTVLVQSAQSTATIAQGDLAARLARWLVMCHDRVEGDRIDLTHEFMGMMIAANRSSVTVALHILEGNGMIRSQRGIVIILDRERLEELAGDSYGVPEAEYRQLIAPFGKS